MAKKKVSALVKIQIPAGGATPAPPVGTALGPHQTNAFCWYSAASALAASRSIPRTRKLSSPGHVLPGC